METTNMPPIAHSPLPLDDPRRGRSADAIITAYPESALANHYETDIEAARRLVRTMKETGVIACKESDEESQITSRDGEDMYEQRLWWPRSDNEVERLIYASCGIDYDEYQREMRVMHAVICGDTPPEEPSATPFTQESAAAFIEEVGRSYQYGNVHGIWMLVASINADEQGHVMAKVMWRTRITSTEWTHETIHSHKEFRSLVARIVTEKAKQGGRGAKK